jgi:hypothetical protein
MRLSTRPPKPKKLISMEHTTDREMADRIHDLFEAWAKVENTWAVASRIVSQIFDASELKKRAEIVMDHQSNGRLTMEEECLWLIVGQRDLYVFICKSVETLSGASLELVVRSDKDACRFVLEETVQNSGTSA